MLKRRALVSEPAKALSDAVARAPIPLSDYDDDLGRRKLSRLRLSGAGRLISFHGSEGVRLDNLSLTGAHLSRRNSERFSECVLRWLEFEAMGREVWAKGPYCGVKFDKPISEDWLMETRRSMPDVPEGLKLPVPSRL